MRLWSLELDVTENRDRQDWLGVDPGPESRSRLKKNGFSFLICCCCFQDIGVWGLLFSSENSCGPKLA